MSRKIAVDAGGCGLLRAGVRTARMRGTLPNDRGRVARHRSMTLGMRESRDTLSQDEGERLAARVLTALREDRHLDAGRIAVGATGRVVSLRGSVDSAMQRSLAEETAWAAGATEVLNELEVTGEPVSRSARRP
jgi:osmotically-inducible protein OsmY